MKKQQRSCRPEVHRLDLTNHVVVFVPSLEQAVLIGPGSISVGSFDELEQACTRSADTVHGDRAMGFESATEARLNYEAFCKRHGLTPKKGFPRSVQKACDRCTHGVMDQDNPHLYGMCECDCHRQ